MGYGTSRDFLHNFATRGIPGILGGDAGTRHSRQAGMRDSRQAGMRDSRQAGTRDSRRAGTRDSRRAGTRDSRRGAEEHDVLQVVQEHHLSLEFQSRSLLRSDPHLLLLRGALDLPHRLELKRTFCPQQNLSKANKHYTPRGLSSQL